jgi:hypothetical protein
MSGVRLCYQGLRRRRRLKRHTAAGAEHSRILFIGPYRRFAHSSVRPPTPAPGESPGAALTLGFLAGGAPSVPWSASCAPSSSAPAASTWSSTVAMEAGTAAAVRAGGSTGPRLRGGGRGKSAGWAGRWMRSVVCQVIAAHVEFGSKV